MLDVISKFLALLSGRERRLLYLQFGLLVGMAAVDMVGIASILPFMAVVSNPDAIHSNRWLKAAYVFFGLESTRGFLIILGMMVLALLVFGNVFKAFYTWFTLKYDNELNFNLGRRLLASYMARPYQFFLRTNTSELSKNVLSECSAVISGVLSPGMQVLANSLLCAFIFALLIIVDPLVAVGIVVVLGGAYGAIYFVVRRRLVTIGIEQVRANYLKFKAAGEALSGIKDLKILGRERQFLDRFAVEALRHARHNATVGIMSQIPRYALETIAFGGILLIVLYSLKTDQDVGSIVPLLSLYAFAGYRLMPALQQLFAGASTMRVNLPALEMLHGDMIGGHVPADVDAILPERSQLRPLPFTRELALEDLTFLHEAAREPVIRGLSLAIPRGTSIGLVGTTGSGKTTLVDLILGLLTPSGGHILADGVDITGANVAGWQRNLGYVPQHIYLSDDTITRNIAFGVPDNEIDFEAVVRAARIANLHDFIERELPGRYETVIGERGVRVSGGQRQRIGIARALYHDPQVLILDEATSALDGITEGAVMEAIRALAVEKTFIIVAHRLTTVKECDVIYIIEKGRIANHGNYDQMLKSSTWFQAASRSVT